MADVFTPEKRSYVMSRVRSRGNRTTEVMLAGALRAARLSGWRRQLVITVPTPGRTPHTSRRRSCVVVPDFVFMAHRIAVFVDGCFWHDCPAHGERPKNNATFWLRKFSDNRRRDRRVNRALRRAGWRVIRIWEHDMPRKVGRHLTRIRTALAATQK
jgi:DNA mismatch endonuclease (patch repair protein)